jgi:hypothetical protein
MQPQIGDRMADSTDEWEVVGRPYTAAGGEEHPHTGPAGEPARRHRGNAAGSTREGQREASGGVPIDGKVHRRSSGNPPFVPEPWFCALGSKPLIEERRASPTSDGRRSSSSHRPSRVIISNCVINLSADKDAVLTEAFRVLKPGGRFAVSDVVVRGEVPSEVRRSVELWIGCLAGALEESEYRAKLAKAGFEDIDLEPTRVYTAESARDFLAGAGLSAEAIASVDGKFMSAFIRARKPLKG